MPRIALENTAAKGADFATRIGKFDDSHALDKLRDIDATLGQKGTGGTLRIIYTTKSNQSLQFETRNKKWWGGLYTPSKERKRKNEIALRELFSKAGKNLSSNSKLELDSALDKFFQKYSKAITSLAPIIARFDKIFQADQQASLIQPNLISDEHSKNVDFEVANHNSGEIIVQESADQLSQTNEQKLKVESHSSIRSNYQDDPHLGEPQILENPRDSKSEEMQDVSIKSDGADQSPSPENPKHISEEIRVVFEKEPILEQNSPGTSFLEIQNENRSSFESNFEFLENQVESFDGVQSSDGGDDQYQDYRASIDLINRISADISVDKRDVRANAAKVLESINKFLKSSFPQEVDDFAKKVSAFQSDRAEQFSNLNERIRDIHSRLQVSTSLPSIPDYFQELEQLNADIQKFSEGGLNETSSDTLAKFEELLEQNMDALRSKLPKSDFIIDYSSDFPEMEELKNLQKTLQTISSTLEEQYPLNEQKPDVKTVQKLYSDAFKQLDFAQHELSENSQDQELPALESLMTQIQDIKEFKAYSDDDYNESALDADRVRLGQIEEALKTLEQIIENKKQALNGLLEKLREDRQNYQKSFGDDLNAGFEFLDSNFTLSDFFDQLIFDQLIQDTQSEIEINQNAAQQVHNLRKLHQGALPFLENVFRQEVDLKEKRKIEEQVDAEKKLAQELQIKKLNEPEKAAIVRLETFEKKLNDALDHSEKLIEKNRADSFEKLKTGFPKDLDSMLSYYDSESKKIKSGKNPPELIEELKLRLATYRKGKLSEFGPIDTYTRDKWEKKISDKLTEWSEGSLYSPDQKQEFTQSIRRDWENKIISEAQQEISKFNHTKSILSDQISSAKPVKQLANSQLQEGIDELKMLIKSQEGEIVSDAEALNGLELQKPLAIKIIVDIDKIEGIGFENEIASARQFKSLAETISEWSGRSESADDAFIRIVTNLQDDENYLSQLESKFSEHLDQISIEMGKLIDRIEATEADITNNKNLLRNKSEMLALAGESNPLESEVRSLEIRIESIKEELSKLGLEIPQ